MHSFLSVIPARFNHDYDKAGLFEFARRKVKWMLGDRAPLIGYLKITNRCNLDCGYCPWHTTAKNFDGEIDTNSWCEIVDKLHSKGVRILVFEGGEPTLRHDLQILINHAKSRQISTILATNGTRRLDDYAPDVLSISIDGTAETHEKIRGKGTHDAIMRILNRKPSASLVSITVITPQNLDDLENLCHQIGLLVDGMLFTFQYPYANTKDGQLNGRQIDDAKHRLQALKKHYPILNPASFLKTGKGPAPCQAPPSISVNHRGRILHGCFVDQIEPRNCDICSLACYQLLSSFENMEFVTWFNLYRIILKRI
jgi:Fe-coproporphyrin III synthase